jgi:large subunit ribosomal protein L24
MAQLDGRGTKVPEIRRGDLVVVLAGKDAGKRGRVERVVPASVAVPGGRSLYRRGAGRSTPSVVVEGVNVAKKHTKPRQRTQGGPGSMPTVDPGGVLDHPLPLPIGKVMLVCPKCDQPTRIAHTTLDNGKRIRVCRNCGEPLEAAS